MNKFSFKYLRFLGAVFLVWLFLFTSQQLGFDLGVDPLIFLLIFLVLALPLFIWLIRKKRFNLRDLVANKITQLEVRFLSKGEKIKEKGIKKLIVLTLAVILVSSEILKRVFFQHIFKKRTILLISILGILVNIFWDTPIFHSSSDLIVISFTALWVLTIWFYQFEVEISIFAGLIFLSFCPFLLALKNDLMAERAGVWAFMLIAVAVFQELIEEIRKEKQRKKIKLADLLNQLLFLIEKANAFILSYDDTQKT